MAELGVKIEGFDPMIAMLKGLGKSAGKPMLRRAMRSFCKVVASSVRQLCPVGEADRRNGGKAGDLKSQIVVRARRRSRRGVGVNVIIGNNKYIPGPVSYASSVNFGHFVGAHSNNETIGIQKGKKRTAKEAAKINALNSSRRYIQGEHFIEAGYQQAKGSAQIAFFAQLRKDIKAYFRTNGGTVPSGLEGGAE